jgi:protein-S-isoprenylcysteine O-methyltransferase Ste14
MKRSLFFIYGVTGHAGFLVLFLYLAGFVGNILVPRSIDSGPSGPIAGAVAIDLLLIAVFGLQHSIMARPGFKAWWTRIVPVPIERSTYVWISNVLVALLIWQWRPIDIVVWDVSAPAGRAALTALFAAGWLLVPLASLMIDHFDLFGTRQVWFHLRRQAYRALPFHTPLLYRWVRHPLYVGWMVAFWATPTMTAGHLLFAGALTAYILIAVQFEERDLTDVYGENYAEYRRRVPRFIPRLSGLSGTGAPVTARPQTVVAREVASSKS